MIVQKGSTSFLSHFLQLLLDKFPIEILPTLSSQSLLFFLASCSLKKISHPPTQVQYVFSNTATSFLTHVSYSQLLTIALL
ncbi:ORF198 [White spot syndrome virus]|uniref:ORF198 n=1 Tax=White spot syndrome virus TaxID=342409 RepID=A0A2D3I609_9VIRU|nr:ORF198 [White spot syndrome virus]